MSKKGFFNFISFIYVNTSKVRVKIKKLKYNIFRPKKHIKKAINCILIQCMCFMTCCTITAYEYNLSFCPYSIYEALVY